MNDDLLLIEDGAKNEVREGWLVLIVDDEQEVHDITTLALSDFQFAGRGLRFLHAYSGREAAEVVDSTPDIAVMLVDVVMETEHAGLELVRHVREIAKRRFARIILRTGQPGQAPERRVIAEYDINDYKQKTELTQDKMFSVMHTSIASYRDLIALDRSRRGLRKIIEAATQLFTLQSMEAFAQGVLEQLAALLYLDDEALVLCLDGLAAENGECDMAILAGTGRYAALIGQSARENLPPAVYSWLKEVADNSRSIGDFHSEDSALTVVYTTPSGTRHLLYVSGDQRFEAPEQELIQLYCECVAKAQHTLQQFATRLQTQIPGPTP
ncbi:MAG: DUF3369 domain-containing protein [Oceanococcaceae bacterium]